MFWPNWFLISKAVNIFRAIACYNAVTRGIYWSIYWIQCGGWGLGHVFNPFLALSHQIYTSSEHLQYSNKESTWRGPIQRRRLSIISFRRLLISPVLIRLIRLILFHAQKTFIMQKPADIDCSLQVDISWWWRGIIRGPVANYETMLQFCEGHWDTFGHELHPVTINWVRAGQWSWPGHKWRDEPGKKQRMGSSQKREL